MFHFGLAFHSRFSVLHFKSYSHASFTAQQDFMNKILWGGGVVWSFHACQLSALLQMNTFSLCNFTDLILAQVKYLVIRRKSY